MIQRVQSVYLLIATIFTSVLFFSPFAELFSETANTLQITPLGIVTLEGNPVQAEINMIPLAILTGLIGFISLITIFFYKNRNLQARLCVLNILFLIGLGGLGYFYLHMSSEQLDMNILPLYPVVFPLISLIFTFLARKGIMKDEKLVKSLDRIR